jgi:putative ATP-binding cassette transporter
MLRFAGPYWNSEQKWRIRGVTLLLFLLTVMQVGLTVWGNYWNRDLFDALEERSVRGVLLQVGVFALIFAASIGVTAAHLLVKRRLQLDWRAWLTERLIGRWMQDGRHYRLLFSAGEHDNPDQRIAEDIRIATESAIALAHTLVYSLLTLGLFIQILWSVPGYMVPLAFLYAGVGSALGWLLGRPLVRSTNALQTAEANFRFGLARAREHSEAIALMHGEPIERSGAASRFVQIVRDFDRQSLAFMGIVSFSTGYGGLLPVFPILVAAPQYIAGAMSLGVLMQAAQAFQRLTSSLSWPVDNVGEIARWRASAERVLSLHEDIARLDEEARAANEHRIALGRTEGRHLLIEDLCIADPSGLILLEHFDAEIRRGERVLVAGDPAVTSSLFKVIAGLWPWGRGRVLLPEDGGVLFMPQRPFLPEGTLRRALCYPRPPDAFADDLIRYTLECAGIAWLAPRLDEQSNWEQVLPLRAQQRLGFARVLMQRPGWVFMEEATDAFDPKGERLILEMLHRELPDAGFLTISFHPGLEKLHHRKIVLSRVREQRYLFEQPRETGAATH